MKIISVHTEKKIRETLHELTVSKLNNVLHNIVLDKYLQILYDEGFICLQIIFKTFLSLEEYLECGKIQKVVILNNKAVGTNDKLKN